MEYASRDALRGYRQGRRDDLESLFYSLMELYTGAYVNITSAQDAR